MGRQICILLQRHTVAAHLERSCAVKNPSKSLADFYHEKRKQDCRVCALPDSVLKQIRDAQRKRLKQAVTVLWLNTEVADKSDEPFTKEELQTHYFGRHEDND